MQPPPAPQLEFAEQEEPRPKMDVNLYAMMDFAFYGASDLIKQIEEPCP